MTKSDIMKLAVPHGDETLDDFVDRLQTLILTLAESNEKLVEALELYAEQERKDCPSGEWVWTPAAISALADHQARMEKLRE